LIVEKGEPVEPNHLIPLEGRLPARGKQRASVNTQKMAETHAANV
jgi:hypothetical protein